MFKLRKDDNKLISEINIIPFTDIVLVILIIFMVTTPLLIQSSIKIRLPHTQARTLSSVSDRLVITVTDSDQIYVNDKRVADLQDLEKYLVVDPSAYSSVAVKADKNTDYGIVAKVLGIAQKKGAVKLELLTAKDTSS